MSDERRTYLTFDRFILDTGGHALFDSGGGEVRLTRGEFALLLALARRAGLVMSRDQLLDSMTGSRGDVYDRSIDVTIWRLRQKIELNPSHPEIIVTVPGIGYKLAAKVLSASERPKEKADALVAASPCDAPSPAVRRHVTVLACEFVGLDALWSQLEPEDAQAAIGAYRRGCSELAARFGSSVTQFLEFLGDSVQCYFGYPEAHEHDAENAIRAGLAIIDAAAAFVPGLPIKLRARVGIASGLVIVGDGGGANPEMIGDAPIVAARLASSAPPDGMLIAAHTRDLVGDLFKYREFGPVTLANLQQTIAACQVVGESMFEFRFDALRDSRLSPMVGREDEMELLWRRWRQSAAGEGRTVLICGEPGIGKSRMVKWLLERVEVERPARLCYQCSPYHKDSPLYPVIAQIEHAARFEKEDSPDRRLDKLEEMLAAIGINVDAAAPLIAPLLSISIAGRYQPLTLSPAQRRRRTLAILVELVAKLAHRRPLLVVFEDVHWADATSLQWLDLVVELAPRAAVMPIITCRTEFKASWSRLPNVSTLLLGRLQPHDVRTMIQAVASGHLDASAIDRIADQADGIPLHAEELTKAVVESALAAPGTSADHLPAHVVVPLTLQDSLRARIDRLGSGREVAPIAAAIGREFSHTLLQRLGELEEPVLGHALAALEKSELVFRYGAPPEATYRFTHTLVQEAAYEVLPKSRRRALHRRIAELLCDPSFSHTETEPEVIAHHFTQAELSEAAAQWWGRAGDRALRRSAYVEALSHLSKALKFANELPAGPEQLRHRLRLQLAYGQTLMAVRGYGAEETTAAFAHALELGTRIENLAERFSVYHGMWVGCFIRGHLGPMRELAGRCIRDVEDSPDSPEAGTAHRMVGVTSWLEGDYAKASRHLEQAVALSTAEEPNVELASGVAQDMGVTAMIYLAFVLWRLGDTRRAGLLMEAARTRALTTSHVPTIVFMHTHAASFSLQRGDARAAIPSAEAGLKLSREHGLPFWFAVNTMLLGSAISQTSDRHAGLTMLREGVALCREQGALYSPFYEYLLATSEGLCGDIEGALARLENQFAENEQSGQHWLDAELHRLHSELLLLRSGDHIDAAERGFLRALAIARDQKTRSFELRAAIGLARLYRSERKLETAWDLLAPVHAQWADNPEMPEVQEAERILLSLRSPADARVLIGAARG